MILKCFLRTDKHLDRNIDYWFICNKEHCMTYNVYKSDKSLKSINNYYLYGVHDYVLHHSENANNSLIKEIKVSETVVEMLRSNDKGLRVIGQKALNKILY